MAGALLGVLVAAQGQEGSMPLTWDAFNKVVHTQPTDASVTVAFTAHNGGRLPIVIDNVQPSCGCTTVHLPARPWRLAPGASGTLTLTVDLIGKSGTLHKIALVHSSIGEQRLGLNVMVPLMPASMRRANRALARHNREALFQGACARCHATPTQGKRGATLFVAACAICHLSGNRASSVPDITQARVPRNAAYWRHIIEVGRPGTMMPAFAAAQGGPLDAAQIDSLIAFLLRAFPRDPGPPARPARTPHLFHDPHPTNEPN